MPSMLKKAENASSKFSSKLKNTKNPKSVKLQKLDKQIFSNEDSYQIDM